LLSRAFAGSDVDATDCVVAFVALALLTGVVALLFAALLASFAARPRPAAVAAANVCRINHSRDEDECESNESKYANFGLFVFRDYRPAPSLDSAFALYRLCVVFVKQMSGRTIVFVRNCERTQTQTTQQYRQRAFTHQRRRRRSMPSTNEGIWR
jgi:hypothetical protein